jgi:hypothetical protein
MFKGIRDTRKPPIIPINYIKLCNGCNIPNKNINKGESMMAVAMKELSKVPIKK